MRKDRGTEGYGYNINRPLLSNDTNNNVNNGTNYKLHSTNMPPLQVIVPPNPMRQNQTILYHQQQPPNGTIIEDEIDQVNRLTNIQENNKINNPIYDKFKRPQYSSPNNDMIPTPPHSHPPPSPPPSHSTYPPQQQKKEKYRDMHYRHSHEQMNPYMVNEQCPCCRGSGYNMNYIPPYFMNLMGIGQRNKMDINFYITIGIFILLLLILYFLFTNQKNKI